MIRESHMTPDPDPIHTAETSAIAANTRASSIAALLAGHVLRDGETVLLALKPSLWFIAFQSALFAAAVVALLVATHGAAERLSSVRRVAFIETAVFLLAGRVMWAVLQWMGRLYVLTDQRVIQITGVFKLDIYDCPLRKIARTQVTTNVRERITQTGSIDIVPKDPDAGAVGTWQTVAKPLEVNEQIAAAIRRAQMGSI